MKKMAFLKNQIKEYSWGSRTFLAQLLAAEGPSPKPQAELWMGAHPQAPSEVMISGRWVSLAEWINQDPTAILGQRVARHFHNKLPFLFKILAAEKPLSIQAHPDKIQAQAGYERENRLHIPLGADNRNYKDDHHKPELICALTDFKGLKGFREIEEIIRLSDITGSVALKSITGLLRKSPGPGALKDFLSEILTLAGQKKTKLVDQVIQGAARHREKEPAFQWMTSLEQGYPGDIGVIAPLFLNLFHLQPGEALFIPPGELHAYLEGAALEIMANSDNVLRGGLTPKHIDVPELLSVIRFEQNPVSILTPIMGAGREVFFPSLADEFLLSRLTLTDDRVYKNEHIETVEILICIQGRAVICDEEEETFDLPQGISVIVPATMNRYSIKGSATLYKASVP